MISGIEDKRGSIPLDKTNRLKLAFKYLNAGLDTSKKINDYDGVQKCYELLSDAYRLSGNNKMALECYRNHIEIKDSIFSKESAKKQMQTMMQYAFETKEAAAKAEQDKKDAVTTEQLKRGRIMLAAMSGGAVLLMIVALVAGFAYKQKNKDNIIIAKEKQRSEDLLLNILPSEVAEELKDKGTAEARYFNDVTVLFTDFKGFTTVAERLTPQQLVNELHNCFKAFDAIMGKYNIEKIKTVGDAYLAVSGLPVNNPKHAEDIVNAAIEIKNFMTVRKKELGIMTFEIRIGIHSGSVVAGIVGVKKFAYDIWGDTVNTAARMEQNSEAGKINISESTYNRVKDMFNCSYRGEIEAKNKGALKMYFVG